LLNHKKYYGNHGRPPSSKKINGRAKVLLNTAITADTDELNLGCGQDQTVNDKPQCITDLKISK
jgi:hypothetical protein